MIDEVDDGQGNLNTRMHVRPLPDVYNESLGSVDVAAKVRWLFADDPSVVVTVENVLELGIAVNSGVSNLAHGLYRGGLTSATNAWVASSAATNDGSVLTLSDAHLPISLTGFQHFFVQMQGDNFRGSGWMAAGQPGITYGFNDDISWLGAAMPGPRPVIDPNDPLTARDLPIKFNGIVPVIANTWEVTLEAGSSDTFLYDGSPITLETQQALLQYRDFSVTPSVLVDDPAGPTDWYWAPADTASVGARRYPVTTPLYQLPSAGSTIEFEQSFFTRETRSIWEFFIGLGQATNAGVDLDNVLGKALFNFSRGLNFLVADRTGRQRYLWMTRVPIQGDGAVNQQPNAPWLNALPEDRVLDGSRSDYRWKGFHLVSELPQIDRVIAPGDTPEVWINNVSSIDEVDLAKTLDPSAFPDYMVEHGSSASRRQTRARALLEPLASTSSLTQTLNEGVAIDTKDTWVSDLWPLFVEAAKSVSPASVPEVDAFVAFVEANKNEGEFDLPPGDEFVAHRTSRVMPFVMILQGIYEREILRTPLLTSAQICLGFDPDVTLPDSTDFNGPMWQPNIDAMVVALEFVASLYENGTGPGGLDNQPLLATWNAQLTGSNVITQMPWNHPRYNDPGVTRWGHCNMLILTPHFIHPIGAPEVLPPPGPTLDFLSDYFMVSFFSGIYPPNLLSLANQGLSSSVPDILPVLSDSFPAIYPVGGTKNTVFVTSYDGYKGYEEALQPFGTNNNSVYFVPDTGGSKVMLSVQLRSGQAAVGRILAAKGTPEITAGIPLNGTGAQDAYSTSEDFVNGVWNELHTSQAFHDQNSSLRFSLTYQPVQ